MRGAVTLLALFLSALTACGPGAESDAALGGPQAADTMAAPPVGGPDGELNRAADEARVLEAARLLIAADTNAALVTVDAEGRPRARTVTTSRPDADFTIWVATRPETRKMDQIRGNENVVLYYNDDDAGTYLSVMGTATLHTDLATKEARNFYSAERTREYWPDYPEGMVLIRVAPAWLEMVGPGIPAQPVTWRPQAVELAPQAEPAPPPETPPS